MPFPDKTSKAQKKYFSFEKDENAITCGAEIIKNGGVIIFPTSGLYGLGADAMDEKAVNKVFSIKKRPLFKPIIVLINKRESLRELVEDIPESAERLIDKIWPGGLTIIFRAKKNLPENLCGNTGKIGIRMANHPAAKALIDQSGCVITGTSANLSGKPPAKRIEDIDREVIHAVDMVLDAGELLGGAGSTIIDITENSPEILRKGAVSEKKIQKVLKTG